MSNPAEGMHADPIFLSRFQDASIYGHLTQLLVSSFQSVAAYPAVLVLFLRRF